MVFKDPWIIFFVPLVFAAFYFIRKKQKTTSFSFPSVALAKTAGSSWKMKFRHAPLILRLLVLLFFVLALAGPRKVLSEVIHKSEGIDIVLAIDASGSMAAEDFTIAGKRTNRLDIVKKVVNEFIGERKSDRIGLVAFAGLAYTVSPLTTDYTWLQSNLDRVELNLIEDGTAIGSAITSALSRLKNSDAKSKVIILLTDGINNAGQIDPLEAARAAETFNIKIYTIGAGSKGYAPYPMKDFFGRQVYRRVIIKLDEEMLKEIADITGAEYFRATDTKSLRSIYHKIDALEKTEIEEIGFFQYEELFNKFLLIALAFLLIEIFLKNTLLLRIP